MEIVECGGAIEKNSLSICRVGNYYNTVIRQRLDTYQVHCEDYRLSSVFSAIYNNMDNAVDKFLQLDKQLYAGNSAKNKKLQTMPPPQGYA